MKKTILLLAVLFISAAQLFAQDKPNLQVPSTGVNVDELPIVYLNHDFTVQFVSPEPIQYVDISTPKIVGDLPVKNILRIRRIDSAKNANFLSVDNAILTIVGETFIAQYKIVYLTNISESFLRSQVEITPKDMKPLDFPGITMSQHEMKKYANIIVGKSPKIHAVRSAAYGIKENLNNVYSQGDYIFLDISFENKTNLKYDIDEIRFKVEDKKVSKATTVQAVEIKPDFIFSTNPSFKKHFRNVYAFKKFTFPGNKILNIEMTEKQISGRVISLLVDYSDLLNADTL